MSIEREDTRLAPPVTEVPSAAGPLLAALTRLEAGDTVGRFRVRRILGEGGMGLVYLAEDPQLGRLVAVKLLRPAPGSRSEEHQRRLLREAQVLARVSHRNLVTVYDVGVHDGVVFVAMEYVRGKTLDVWLKARPRAWPEVLRTFIEAGQGLTAVHDAGLVHRDFKPGNAMVAEDGRVLILDFGLARPSLVERGPDEAAGEAVQPTDDTLGVDLTRAGGILGTPAYMAPEQHLAIPADARADQFSYCVALYEALYGERPFWGRDEIELMEAALRGLPKLPAARGDLPLEVRRALLRGLTADREGRFPTMSELLDVLTAAVGTKRPRRRVAPLFIAGTALVMFTAGVTWRLAGGDGSGSADSDGEGAEDAPADTIGGSPEAEHGPDRSAGAETPEPDGESLPGIDELPAPAEGEGTRGSVAADGLDAGLPDPGEVVRTGSGGGTGGAMLPGIGDEAASTGEEAPAQTSGAVHLAVPTADEAGAAPDPEPAPAPAPAPDPAPEPAVTPEPAADSTG